MNNRLFGLSGSNFNSMGGSENRSLQSQKSEENPNTPANQMKNVFANDVKMARESCVVGNYSISVQKYRKAIKLVE
jgi:hypothetical protein